jgi:signal transduction histidine kinase
MMIAEKMAAVGRLAVGVAHEVNNPLATIVTCAGALQERLTEIAARDADTAEFEEYLEIVQQEAFRAKRISENLLDFGRSKQSDREPTDFAEICERTLRVLKHHSGFNSVDVEREFEAELPPVLAEADALVQVLVALVVNALDAMPDGGRLTLSAHVAEDEVCCAVRDTGCGIGREDLPNIFEPFFTTKPVGHGTGLGLAVCYGIVQSHGGRIKVDSTVGEGTTFSVVLPAAAHVPQEVHG